MKVQLLGDIHGQSTILKKIDHDPPIIQLGDLNLLGYDNWYWHGHLDKYKFEYPFFFIDGNHDNFSLLNPDSNRIEKIKENLFYIPRGFKSGDCMFIGGADSIDVGMRYYRHYRKDQFVETYDWFEEEQISHEQSERILDMVAGIKAFITHEAPLSYIEKQMHCYRKPSQVFLDTVFEIAKPKIWFHAHYHKSMRKKYKNCWFYSLDVDEVMPYDLPLGNEFSECISL